MAFYLELSSESSRFKASNKANSFRIQINPPIPLKGEWSVALTEISLPRFRNDDKGGIGTKVGDKIKQYVKVNFALYDDAEELLAGIKALDIRGVTLQNNNGRVSYVVQEGMELGYTRDVAAILGLSPNGVTGKGYADDRVDMHRGLKPILFQTSLISPQNFRESRRPILRSLYHQGHFELTPKYCKVVDRDLEELSFYLTTVDGKPVHFLPGSVDFTLHFMPAPSGR